MSGAAYSLELVRRNIKNVVVATTIHADTAYTAFQSLGNSDCNRVYVQRAETQKYQQYGLRRSLVIGGASGGEVV